MPSHHWARNFTVTDDDIDYLTGLLLERETPLSSAALATALVQRRLTLEADRLREQYRGARAYNPAQAYEVGQKIVFPNFDYAMAVVTDTRPGDNPEYGPFNVIEVQFDDTAYGDHRREFASEFTAPHKLSHAGDDGVDSLFQGEQLSADDILAANEEAIIGQLEARLADTDELVALAGTWFPRDLMLEVNDGHLFLADAVLDLAQGGPMTTADILDQIGGLGDADRDLQIFSLNYALNQDKRFDEVGPAGQVLWYLTRLEPPEVLETPTMLRYSEIDYDRGSLTPDMLALEAEIDDEHSPIKDANTGDTITITLIYPHRRVGTLPLNAKMRRIFPTARRTEHIWVTLVDGQDGEEFQGWVVRKDRYVFGLTPFYRKHRLPVGAYVSVRRGDEPNTIIVDYRAHRPRTEWIRLMTPKNNQMTFENHKRAIGAEYDDLMIVGADDITAVDALFTAAQQSRRPLATILRQLTSELSRLTPQGTVHFKSLYSATNVVRRTPPGPMMATLLNEPEFEHVGNHYWKLAGTS